MRPDDDRGLRGVHQATVTIYEVSHVLSCGQRGRVHQQRLGVRGHRENVIPRQVCAVHVCVCVYCLYVCGHLFGFLDTDCEQSSVVLLLGTFNTLYLRETGQANRLHTHTHTHTEDISIQSLPDIISQHFVLY